MTMRHDILVTLVFWNPENHAYAVEALMTHESESVQSHRDL